MSRRKFRLTAPKNWERKKYAKPESLVVSIPLSVRAPTVIDNLCKLALPSRWSFATTEDDSEIRICKIEASSSGYPAKVYATVEVRSTLEWTIFIYSHELQPQFHPELSLLPHPIRHTDDLVSIIRCVDSCTLCIGNNDEAFTPLVERHKEDFRDPKGSQVAVYDQDHHTIRHTGCQLLISSGSRCMQCTTYCNNSLRREANRLKQLDKENSDPSNPSSHINYRFMTTPERNNRIRRLHDQVRVKEKSLQVMRKQASRMIQNSGINLDADFHHDLLSVMKSQSDCPGNDTFLSLFWRQQMQASSLQNIRSMRWHPILIKWCLLLFRKSSSAYETIRKTGILKLPSGRTLRDYSHYTASVPGFTAASDVQLKEASSRTKPQYLSHHVILLIDEMYVKEGLVYNKTTGALVGFIDLGDINNFLHESASSKRRPIAKTVAVFMVRGLFSDLAFPYAVFPAVSLSGSDLYPLMWEAIGRLTMNGYRVHAVTADGAKPNRKLFSLHDPKSKQLPFKVENVFSPEHHPIYFISDPPHLIKTTRNCLASGKRNLWCQGQNISFDHIVQLYERKFTTTANSPGLTLVPKLSFEHVSLSSFSKMRVDLAAQTLSESVSHALYLTGGSKAFETAYFIEKVDKFFDCLNVSFYNQGKLKRKPFQQPYRSPNDFRLQYLRDFLKYLDAWEKSVLKRQGFTAAEKKRMLLSQETLSGIKMTVSSFLELVPLLLKLPGVHCFLSAKLNQDPLEKFFGRVRQFGRVNENPTVSEMLKSTQALKVIDNIHLDDIIGNCRGQKRKGIEIEDVDCKPLPKRLRRRRPSK